MKKLHGIILYMGKFISKTSYCFFIKNNLFFRIPAAPPLPDQWQTATEQHHHPPQAPERPISASSSEQHSTTDNLRDIIASIEQRSHEKPLSLFPPGQIQDSQSHSRPSTASRSQYDPDEDDEDEALTPMKQPAYATVQPRQRSRQSSIADSIESGSSTSPSRHSPVSPLQNNYQQKSSVTPIHQQQQQDDKIANRPSSVASSKRSSERFPPPPQNFETLDFGGYRLAKPLSTSSKSTRSSAYVDAPEPMTTNEVNHSFNLTIFS